MNKDFLTTMIVVILAVCVWVPAIIWSVRRVLRKDKNANNQNQIIK